MDEKSIARITVGRHSISIAGLEELISGLAAGHAEKSDEAIAAVMLAELEKTNYIPSAAREDYGKAFVREFRKRLGQPYTEEASGYLEIRVLGAGCAQCNKLEQLVMEALVETGVPADLQHVFDFKEIARYKVMGVPALVIGGKVVATGKVPSKEEIKSLIRKAAQAGR